VYAVAVGVEGLCLAAGGDAQERGPAPLLLHARVQGGAAHFHRQLQGGGPGCCPKHAAPFLAFILSNFACPQKNFGRPVEWAMVKDYAWSTPQLRKLDVPVCNAPRCAHAALLKLYSREKISALVAVGAGGRRRQAVAARRAGPAHPENINQVCCLSAGACVGCWAAFYAV